MTAGSEADGRRSAEPVTTLFSGVGVALVTVFDEAGDVDPGSTGKLAADFAGRGVRAVLVCGSTGEAATLSDTERTVLIEAVRAAVPAGVPVIAGTGAPSSRQATALNRAAVLAGADAVLTWCPAGGPELAGYFAAVHEAADGRSVLAYQNPWMSSAEIPVDAGPAARRTGSLPGRGLRRIVWLSGAGRAHGRRWRVAGPGQRRARGLRACLWRGRGRSA